MDRDQLYVSRVRGRGGKATAKVSSKLNYMSVNFLSLVDWLSYGTPQARALYLICCVWTKISAVTHDEGPLPGQCELRAFAQVYACVDVRSLRLGRSLLGKLHFA